MSVLKLGSYEIESQKVYDALTSSGATEDKFLQRFDTNNDMKISENELVAFLEEDSKKNTSSEGDSTSSNTKADAISKRIKAIEEQCMKLEEELNNLSSLIATSKDFSSMETLIDQQNAIYDQLDNNRTTIYNLLLESEGVASDVQDSSAVSSASGISSDYSYDTSKVTTGEGINGGSEFGNSVVSTALSYVGKLKETDGSYLKVTGGRHEAWCADFVTYVVKEAASKTGKSLNGFGSPSVASLRAWGEANKCYIDVAGSSNRAKTIVNNVQPGDVMIQQSNGASHTGIVIKVYPDGSFDTVEGNTSDQCLKRHYDANSSRLSGFVKIT